LLAVSRSLRRFLGLDRPVTGLAGPASSAVGGLGCVVNAHRTWRVAAVFDDERFPIDLEQAG
jgi:hypothetical protein